MLNFGRRDRLADAKNADKNVLKPALYDPPGSAGRTTAAGAVRPTGGIGNSIARCLKNNTATPPR